MIILGLTAVVRKPSLEPRDPGLSSLARVSPGVEMSRSSGVQEMSRRCESPGQGASLAPALPPRSCHQVAGDPLAGGHPPVARQYSPGTEPPHGGLAPVEAGGPPVLLCTPPAVESPTCI